MKTIIHVNQHIIKSNAKTGSEAAPLTVKDYTQNRKARIADILDDAGNVVARVRYEPNDPLSCGARVWVETHLKVRTS